MDNGNYLQALHNGGVPVALVCPYTHLPIRRGDNVLFVGRSLKRKSTTMWYLLPTTQRQASYPTTLRGEMPECITPYILIDVFDRYGRKTLQLLLYRRLGFQVRVNMLPVRVHFSKY